MKQLDLLRKVLEDLERLGITYMLVGSYASMVYGEPRFTNDIDVVADLKLKDVDPLCSSFPGPDFYVSRQAIVEAVKQHFQFNIIHSPSGNKVDFMMPSSDEWGRTQLSRRRHIQVVPDLAGYAASPEDVILGKMKYYQEGGSEKHLRDITGIFKMSGEQLDRENLELWVRRLGFDEVWEAVLQRLNPTS